MEYHLQQKKALAEALLPYDNVEIYDFQARTEWICDLNQYIDAKHYGPDINDAMAEEMAAGLSRVTDAAQLEANNDVIRALAAQPKVCAIGEIGLDYYWDRSYNDIQKEVFALQIEFAKKHNKPVIVHDREAHGDCLEILKRTNAAQVGVIMHCFLGSPEFALECVKEGFYIALGGVVTFKNAKKMKEVAKIVPLEKLLVETDSPYLTPVPYRGKRNEPAYVKYAAQEIAQLRGMSFEELARATTENAMKIFRLNEAENG